MNPIDMVEHDLLEMKANTLYKYGKKLEIAEDMYHQKLKLLDRLQKILLRLESETVIKHGWKKKKRQAELTERVRSKIIKTDKTVRKLEELKNKYMEEFKYQREACGMLDHSFIDEFYKEN
jgi:hypothetical protein